MSCINLPTVLPGSPSKTRGQIQVILGPMFSGKSTELMRRVRRFQIAQYKCLVIKYAKDTRYSSNFSTHDRNTMEALPACVLRDVAQEALGVAVIGIDEGQFFPDIVEFSETMANAGKTVIVAALDGTFQRKVEVIGGADKYHSVCRLCYFKKASGQPVGLDSKENKENCPVLGKPGEAMGARKLFAPHQILQCSPAN
ncbi:thymidine kinase, cytosolic isoform X3 [Lagenorhynchus albirostris]|uniref:thymidine kinase, cytosolic isoform X3 n=1 Tax=Lagenorhynchus albirostris TaxID=27610 RepID=UPI0028EEEFE2|nr:thymidine kinase, cytosolic isoform X3 [Lagenorhynchus albirostris]